MSTEIIGRKGSINNEMSFINNSFNTEMNIYNQVHLDRCSALKKAYVIEKSNTDLGVAFQLHGELKGSIICLVDIYNKEIKDSDTIFFQSLFMESMNILLGSFLTNLEELSGIMSVISNPKFLSASTQINGEIADNLQSMNVWHIKYGLNALNTEFDTNIYIISTKKQVLEV